MGPDSFHVALNAAVFLSLFTLLGINFRRFSIPWTMIPGVGLLVFLSVVPPVSFFIGRFAPWTVILTLFSAVGWLAYSSWRARSRLDFSSFQPRLASVAIIVVTIVVFMTTVMTVARYPVPMGADAISHARYAEEIRSSGTVRITYPIGGHMSIAFVGWLFDEPMHRVLQGFHVASYVIFLLTIVGLARVFSQDDRVAIGALAFGLLDASFYNNLLNGSTSHLVGTIAVMTGGGLFAWRYLRDIRFGADLRGSALLASLVCLALLYGHTTSYLYFLVFVAVVRSFGAVTVGAPVGSRWFLGGGIAVLLLALPFYGIIISNSPSYAFALGGIALTLVLLEGFLFLLRRLRIVRWREPSRVLTRRVSRNVMVLVVVVSAVVFFRGSFQNWYGFVPTLIATIGLLIISLRTSLFSFFVVFFGAIASLFLLNAAVPSQLTFGLGIIYGYLLYQGLTFPYVLAAIALFLYALPGRSEMFRSGASLKLAVGLTTLVSLFAVPTLFLRAFDVTSGPQLSLDVYATSRFQVSSGFGVFLKSEDIRLATWMRKNLPPGGRIFNLGGFYSAWYFISGHPTVYDRGGMWPFNVPYQTSQVREMLSKLAEWDESIVGLFERFDIRYVVVPADYPVLLQQPFLHLLREEGGSRLYEVRHSADAIQPAKPFLFVRASDITNYPAVQSSDLSVSAVFNSRLYLLTYDNDPASVEPIAQIARGGKVYVSFPRPDSGTISVEVAGYSGSLRASVVDGTVGSEVTFKGAGVQRVLTAAISSRVKTVTVLFESTGTEAFRFASFAVYE